MKAGFVNGNRAVVGNDQAAIVAKPTEGAFDFPTTTVTAQFARQNVSRIASEPTPPAFKSDRRIGSFTGDPSSSCRVTFCAAADATQSLLPSAAELLVKWGFCCIASIR